MRNRDAGPPGRGGRIQVFSYGPLDFNVNRALLLAADRRKYRPERRRPEPHWVGPFIEIDPAHVERCDPSRPILFVTLAIPGRPRELLIDGNHRAAHALKYGKEVRAIVLDLEDTLRVVSGPADLIRTMKEEGRRLGLLPPERPAAARTPTPASSPAR
jgi:hypothetical protein